MQFQPKLNFFMATLHPLTLLTREEMLSLQPLFDLTTF
jgi:hypothetical protein